MGNIDAQALFILSLLNCLKTKWRYPLSASKQDFGSIRVVAMYEFQPKCPQSSLKLGAGCGKDFVVGSKALP